MTVFTALAGSASNMSCPTIDTAQVLLLNELDAANERLAELSFKAAMPGGDETLMIAAEADVQRIKQKLEGLKFGRARAEREESERVAEETAGQRREAAVEILSLIAQRYSAAVALDRAASEFYTAIENLEALGDKLSAASTPWFSTDSRRGEDRQKNFLMSLGCFGLTDIAARATRDAENLRLNYSHALPLERRSALRTLAQVVPEVEDESVIEEAAAAAKQAKLDASGG